MKYTPVIASSNASTTPTSVPIAEIRVYEHRNAQYKYLPEGQVGAVGVSGGAEDGGPLRGR